MRAECVRMLCWCPGGSRGVFSARRALPTGFRGLLVLVVAALSCSCASTLQDLSAEDPLRRFKAVAAYERTGGREGTAGLIDALEDPDDTIRDFAAQALKNVTGESFGYDFAASPDERARMVQRWREWWSRTYPSAEPVHSSPEPGS